MGEHDERTASEEKNGQTRRHYLKATAVGVAGVSALAGCNSGGSGQDANVPEGVPAEIETQYWHDWANTDRDKPPRDYTASAGATLDSISIQFSSQNAPWMRDCAFMIQRGVEELGASTELVDTPINQLYGSGWSGAGLKHEFAMATHGPDAQRAVDPNPLIMRRYSENPSNYDKYRNPEMEELLPKQRSTTGNREERLSLVNEALDIYTEDVGAIIPVFPDVVTALSTNNWEGYVMTPGNGPTGDSFQWSEVNLQPTGDDTTYVKGTVAAMNSLNIGWAAGGAEEKRLKYIYDGLFDVSPNLEMVPGLATDAKFTDDTTVEMSLREGVQWHDGESFTAEDVKFTVDYYNANTSTSQSTFYTPIESAEVLGDHSVRFNLKFTDASFLTQRMARSAIIPKHKWENVENPSQHNPENPVGTSAFQFEEWSSGTRFVLSRNDDHWMWDNEFRQEHLGSVATSNPGVEKIVWRNLGNVDALIGGLQNGQIDAVAGTLSNSQANRAANTQSVEKRVVDNFSPLHCMLNHSVPLIRDKEFRVAVAMSIDKEGFVEQVLQGRGTVPSGENFISQLTGWSTKEHHDYEYDPEGARQILREAGYTTNGSGTLQFPNGEAWGAFVKRIQPGNTNKRREELGQSNFAE